MLRIRTGCHTLKTWMLISLCRIHNSLNPQAWTYALTYWRGARSLPSVSHRRFSLIFFPSMSSRFILQPFAACILPCVPVYSIRLVHLLAFACSARTIMCLLLSMCVYSLFTFLFDSLFVGVSPCRTTLQVSSELSLFQYLTAWPPMLHNVKGRIRVCCVLSDVTTAWIARFLSKNLN